MATLAKESAVLKASMTLLGHEIERAMVWDMARFNHRLVDNARMADGRVADAKRDLKKAEDAARLNTTGVEHDQES